MRRIPRLVLACVFALISVSVSAQEISHLYLVPVQSVTNNGSVFRGPKYFKWRFGTGTVAATTWSMMDYGFLPTALLYAQGLSSGDEAFLAGQADVYEWPENLDLPITDPRLSTFLEGIRVPTDWVTPSSTYRQMLRNLAGLFQFAQRYAGLSGNQPLFDAVVTLETNYRSLSAERQGWFEATAASFNYPQVSGNPKLRSLVKQIGDLWGAQPFFLGGLTF